MVGDINNSTEDLSNLITAAEQRSVTPRDRQDRGNLQNECLKNVQRAENCEMSLKGKGKQKEVPEKY